MKTDSQVKLIKEIDLSKLMVETDCPYCLITPGYAGYKLVENDLFKEAVNVEKYEPKCFIKRRNEPATLKMVCEVIAKVKGMKSEEVMKICKENAEKMIAG
jgi:TatD DNase family protein